MPWKTVKRNCKQTNGRKGSYVVVKKKSKGGTEQESCHTSEDKAKAAVRARYASKNELSKSIEENVMKLTRKQLKKFIVEMMTPSLGSIVNEMQAMVDQNQFLQGNVVDVNDLIETPQYVIYASEEGLMHTKDRHMNVNAPGSTMFSDVNLSQVISAVASTPKTSGPDDFMVKWEGVISPTGPVGEMGVLYANPEIVARMQDYQMPGGRQEMVKVAPGKRIMTELVTLVTAPLGILSDGRQALSLVTMYPGGNDVEGVIIPRDRNDFAALGLYFPLPPDSPILQ